MNQNTDNINFNIPEAFVLEIKNLKPGECLLGPVIVERKRIPTICVSLSPEDFNYFGMGSKPFMYNWKFRYLDDGKKNEMIEISLRYKINRILAILLDPINDSTKQFLQLMLQQKNFGFHFYCKDKKQFAGNLLEYDNETYLWLKRNHPRSKKLKNNHVESILKARMDMGKSSERFYVGKNIDCIGLTDRTTKLIPFESVQQVLFL